MTDEGWVAELPGIMEWWPIRMPAVMLPGTVALINMGTYLEVRGRYASVSIEPRPRHCDRGRYVAKIDWAGQARLEIEPVDGWDFGRFYMNLERAVAEVAEWLADREGRIKEEPHG